MSTDQTRPPLHDSTRHPNQPLHDSARHTSQSQSQVQSQPLHESAPAAYQAIKFMTAASIGATLTVLFGLTLTGTVLALILVTPLLVLFSPVLVPAAIVAVLATGGFVLSGVFGVAALAALVWLYRCTTGKHPAWSDQLDYARTRIGNKAREIGQYGQDMARDATNKAREMGQYGQDMARNATNKAREMGQYGQDMAGDATNQGAAGGRHNYVDVS